MDFGILTTLTSKGNQERRYERQQGGEDVEDGRLGEDRGLVEALQGVAKHRVHRHGWTD